MEAFDAYWVPLGWAKEAPILTQSRIDTPRPGSVAAGPSRSLASPGRQTAASRRSRSGSTGSGRRPACRHRSRTRRGSSGSTSGTARQASHRIEVRATDGTGEVQTDQRTPPAPDGARGWHSDGRDRRLSRAQIGIESSHAATSLHLRSTGALRDRDDRRTRPAHVLPAGTRRRSRGQRCPRKGPGGGPRRPPRPAAVELDKRGIAPEDPIDSSVEDTSPLDEPLNEAFRAGALTLGWDGDAELILVEARAESEDGEPSTRTRTTTRTRTAPTCCACG